MKKEDILAELENVIFPSKEDDGIEAVDMSYKDFMRKLHKLAEPTK